MRAVVGSTATVRTDPYDGTPTEAAAVVVDAAGATLPAPACTLDGASAVVVLTATEHLAQLDRLNVTVTATVDGAPQVQVVEVEVVGSHYLTVAALRNEPDLADPSRFSDQLLAQVRDEWCDEIERVCHRRFVPSLEVLRITGRNGWLREVLPVHDLRSVRTVLVDGTALEDDAYRVDVPAGLLSGLGAFDCGAAVEVHAEVGLDRPPPKLVRELRKVVRREVLARGARGPSDAISETSPEGGVTVRYSTPDPRAGRWTGVLSLDPVLTELRLPQLGIA